jgi:hypothetical protein
MSSKKTKYTTFGSNSKLDDKSAEEHGSILKKESNVSDKNKPLKAVKTTSFAV